MCHASAYDKYIHPTAATSEYVVDTPPTQMRWGPIPLPNETEAKEGDRIDFVRGLCRMAGAGDPSTRAGTAFYVYSANEPMTKSAFINADGDMLIVPQEGGLIVKTEMGFMHVPPGFICVVQRGIAFSVLFAEGTEAIRGYVCEVFDGHFEIPDLGPIGANGLANPRDFETPVAAYDSDSEDPSENAHVIISKFLDVLYESQSTYSPFNVVAWHGNYAPFRYDLSRFCTINSVSFDHIDPCIFTVLTCQTNQPGTAALDFVIFPPRWSVAQNTFKPPYYHKNAMSEFMGLIFGQYEAKKEGFLPGGASLHSCCQPHGPDKAAFEYGSNQSLEPERVADGTMAFMFESVYTVRLTKYSLSECGVVDEAYSAKAWSDLESTFDPNNINP